MDGRFMEARRMSNMSKELPKMGNRKQQIGSVRIGIFVKVDEAAAIDETVTADTRTTSREQNSKHVTL